MNKSTVMPDDGQFVAIWRIDGVVFSATFLHDDGELLAYDFMRDDWVLEHGYDSQFFVLHDGDVMFFQVEDE